jgi:hypothetical protein
MVSLIISEDAHSECRKVSDEMGSLGRSFWFAVSVVRYATALYPASVCSVLGNQKKSYVLLKCCLKPYLVANCPNVDAQSS